MKTLGQLQTTINDYVEKHPIVTGKPQDKTGSYGEKRKQGELS